MSVHLNIVFMDDSYGHFSGFNSWDYSIQNGVERLILKYGGERTPGLPRTEIPVSNIKYVQVIKHDEV